MDIPALIIGRPSIEIIERMGLGSDFCTDYSFITPFVFDIIIGSGFTVYYELGS
jgi:hypothetical protein